MLSHRSINHVGTFVWQRWGTVILIVAGMLAYSNSFGGTFVFDDIGQIERHSFAGAFGPTLLQQPRPLGYLTLAINHAIHGKNVLGYHVVNLIIHLSAACVLFHGLRRLLALARLPQGWNDSATIDGLALTAAVWWVVHPLQTQAVTYIIQRYESLASLFYLVTVTLFLQAMRQNKNRLLGESAVCCWLGMLSKEILITAPWLILAIDRLICADTWWELIKRRGWYYVVMITSIALPLSRLWDVQTLTDSQALVVKGISTWDYACTQPRILLHYLFLSIWPKNLCLDYGWPVATGWAEFLPSALIVVAMLIVTVALWWRSSFWSLVGIWFFFTLATTSSFLVLADLAVEHRMYLALAAITTLVAFAGYGITEFVGRSAFLTSERLQWLRIGGVMVVTAALACGTFLRNFDYYSWRGMWLDVIAKAPNNSRGYSMVGTTFREAGDNDSAIPYLQQALKLSPQHPLTNQLLALIYIEQEQPAKAWPYIDFLKTLDGEKKGFSYGLAGQALRMEKKLNASERSLQTAIELQPDWAMWKIELARVYILQEKYAAAEKALMDGIQQDPKNAYGCYLRGLLGLMAQQPADAEHWFNMALRLEPGNQKYHDSLLRARQIRAEQNLQRPR